MTGLLGRLLAALLEQRDAPKQMDALVFEPACVPRWDDMVAGMDDMAQVADVGAVS